MSANPACPYCQATDTVWKAKVQEWECNQCDKRFDVSPDPTASAEEEFVQRARRLAGHAAWHSAIITRWPGPLAFTYRLLQRTLEKGQVDASALVLKDFAELLARFSALVMARDVLTRGCVEDQTYVRRELLGKPASMGSWLVLADYLARKCLANPGQFQFPEIASLWRDRRGETALKELVTQLVTWRNATLGHGVRGDDLEGTMASLEEFLGTDDAKKSLHAALEPHAHLFDAIQLIDGKARPIIGADAVSPEHQNTKTHTLDAAEGLVLVDTGRTRRLELRPFLVARRCQVCNQFETFHFDSLRGGKAVPDARLFNYERGHAYNGLADGDMQAEYGQLDVQLDSSHSFDQEAISQDLSKMLEEQSIGRSYLSPGYLRDPVKSFIETGLDGGQGGLYWLRAPAHVGKTTFVQGLDPDRRGLLREDALLDELAVAVFYIRREYQFHPAQFADQLRDSLKVALNLRAQTRTLPALDIAEPDHRAAFCRFIEDFQQLGGRPLLVVIDGLDELAEQDPGIADFLPLPSMLPVNVFILLTSRREDELAPWLLRATDHLKGAKRRDIDLTDDEYVALMDKYAEGVLAKRPQLKGQEQALLPALREKSDGRFLYFRFLVDRLADGELQVEDLARLTDHAELLVPRFIDALLKRYAGTPMADRIQRVLLNLAAAEEVFEGHQQQLPEMVRSPWTGLPMEVLGGMVESQAAMTSNLALSLYLLKPLLGTWRKDDKEPQYRLGIKGLSDAICKQFRSELDELEENHVRRVLDLFRSSPDRKNIPLEIVWSARYLDGYPSIAASKSPDRLETFAGDAAAFSSLAEFCSGEAAIAERRWNDGRDDDHDNERANARVWRATAAGWFNLAVMAHDTAAIRCDERALPVILNNTARDRLRRGDFAYATHNNSYWDYDYAVSALEFVQEEYPEQLDPAMEGGLAGAYAARANSCIFFQAEAERPEDLKKSAVNDFDRSIAIWKSLNERFGFGFTPAMVGQPEATMRMRELFDAVFDAVFDSVDRIVAKINLEKIAENGLSKEQLDKLTISQVTNLLVLYLQQSLRVGLAMRLKNAKALISVEAVDALRSSIEIQEYLRERKGEDLTVEQVVRLACDRLKLGIAYEIQGDLLRALEQFDMSAAVGESLRDQLSQQLLREQIDELAVNYVNRSDSFTHLGDLGGASHDYHRGIALRESLSE